MTIANVFLSDTQKVGMSSEINVLYDYVIPPLAKRIEGDFADEAEANLMCEYISLTDLSQDDFNFAYSLFVNACNNEKSLKPYLVQFEKAFQSDPRYKQP